MATTLAAGQHDPAAAPRREREPQAPGPHEPRDAEGRPAPAPDAPGPRHPHPAPLPEGPHREALARAAQHEEPHRGADDEAPAEPGDVEAQEAALARRPVDAQQPGAPEAAVRACGADVGVRRGSDRGAGGGRGGRPRRRGRAGRGARQDEDDDECERGHRGAPGDGPDHGPDSRRAASGAVARSAGRRSPPPGAQRAPVGGRVRPDPHAILRHGLADPGTGPTLEGNHRDAEEDEAADSGAGWPSVGCSERAPSAQAGPERADAPTATASIGRTARTRPDLRPQGGTPCS